MIEPCFCFIKEQYFIDNPNLTSHSKKSPASISGGGCH